MAAVTLAAVAVSGAASRAALAASPVAVDLGTLASPYNFSSRALAVNNRAEIMGISTNSIGNLHAFFWAPFLGMHDIGTLGGTNNSPSAMNNAGQVVGQSGLAGDPCCGHAYIWTPGLGIHDLGTLGGTFSAAYSINDWGQVVGQSTLPGDQVSHGFIWTAAGGMVDLGALSGGESGAMWISNGGQIAGQASLRFGAYTHHHAVIWTRGTGMIDLGTLQGAESDSGTFCCPLPSNRVVNAVGQVAGWAKYSTATNDATHAFFWSAAGGMIDLGVLPGGTNSMAVAISPKARVIGSSTGSSTHAFTWTSAGGMVDLGTLGGSITTARAVNIADEIVGQSSLSGDRAADAFSWTPGAGMVDLGSLGGNGSDANGLSDRGLIVGMAETAAQAAHATLWLP